MSLLNGIALYNSSNSLPIQPPVLPPRPTMPRPPANHSPATAADIPLIAYHLLFLIKCLFDSVSLTCGGVRFNHFAHPHAKCQAPTPIKAVKPANEIIGFKEKPWLMYERLIIELSPCMYGGSILVVQTWNPASGINTYPRALMPLIAGQGIVFRSVCVSAPYRCKA
jgi:hypothetical protein